MNKEDFDYQEAFSRNIGLLTDVEQVQLRGATIALCGSGAVSSAYLIALVRQGFEKFKVMEVAVPGQTASNQEPSAVSDESRYPEMMALKDEMLKINPCCEVEFFSDCDSHGFTDDFFSGVCVTIDAIDVGRLPQRRVLYDQSLKRSIPVLGAESDRFGITYYVFLPGGPTFDECFSHTRELSSANKPSMYLRNWLPSFLKRSVRAPAESEMADWSTLVGTLNLRAGIIVIYALKVLLRRGPIKAMPYYHQFDVLGERYGLRQLWWAQSGFLQRLKLRLALCVNK